MTGPRPVINGDTRAAHIPDVAPRPTPVQAAAACRAVAAAATDADDLRDLLTVLGLIEPAPVPVVRVPPVRTQPPPDPPAPCGRGGHPRIWRWQSNKARWWATCDTCRNKQRRATYAEQKRND